MNDQSDRIRNEIAKLQEAAQALKAQANKLIERAKDLKREIDKRSRKRDDE
jgi:uncharacterized coiled-coil DUF342 family protein